MHSGDTEITEVNVLTDQVIGAAIEVHKVPGPGLLESAYQRALAHEFSRRGLRFEQQKVISVGYKDLVIEDAHRLDFLVGNQLVIEIKAVDQLEDVHTAQVFTYLKFTGCRLGLLLNSRTNLLTHGLRRIAL